MPAPRRAPKPMSDEERERIRALGAKHGIEAARRQGLPDTIKDPEVLRKVAIMVIEARKNPKTQTTERDGGDN